MKKDSIVEYKNRKSWVDTGERSHFINEIGRSLVESATKSLRIDCNEALT